nr:transposase [Rhizobium sullae]
MPPTNLDDRHKQWQRTASRATAVEAPGQGQTPRRADRGEGGAPTAALATPDDDAHRAALRRGRPRGPEDPEHERLGERDLEEPGTNVARKAGLNRSIRAAAWYRFERLLTYKLAFLGGTVVKVDPRYTSVTCSKCGSRDKGNPRKPSEVPLPLLRTRRPRRRQRGGQHTPGWNTAIGGVGDFRREPKTRKGGLLKPPLKISVRRRGRC